MLADLKIARKLSLLLVLPMATFLFVVSAENIQRWKTIDHLKAIERSLVVSLSAGELIHELQKERGYTAGFLGSKGKRFSSELAEQTDKSNSAYKNFTAVLAGADSLENDSLARIFAASTQNFTDLSTTRNAARDARIDALQAIAAYNISINELIAAISELNARADLAFTSIIQLLHGKEIAGQERATLNAAFSAGTFSKQLYRDWLYRVSSQNTYLSSFAELGGKAALNLLQSKMQSVDEEVKRFRDTAYANLEKSSLEADPQQWFAASTRRIDKLMEVEKAWGDQLLGNAREEVRLAQRSLLIAVSAALLVAFFTILLGWRICITIGRPVRSTLRYAQGITHGDFDSVLTVKQNDEIGGLADVLREMVTRLKEQIQTANNSMPLLMNAATWRSSAE